MLVRQDCERLQGKNTSSLRKLVKNGQKSFTKLTPGCSSTATWAQENCA